VEARSLHWLSWAQRACAAHAGGADGTAAGVGGGGGDADGFAAAAAALAATPPLAAPLGALRLVSLHDGAPPAQAARVFNGALVGLIAGGADPNPAAQSPDPQTHDHDHHQQQQPPPLRPCVGLGLVRAIDAAAGLLYLLTDAPPAALAGVRELHAGRLELPQPLLQAGPGCGGAPPYDALFCLGAAATGAGAHRSRNNLLRASLLPQGGRQ
jgi:polynucleotide 5'-hydroxyl-kinase GRC3/NOL9